MEDIIKPVAEWISHNIPWAVLIGLFVISLFFEISKIQIYPLKWLWKLISWPFRKIDEQRTESFKNIVKNFSSDIDSKFTAMSEAQDANYSSVRAYFVELDKRFDKLETKQLETEEKLDTLAAARIKNHVLNFARQCRKGEPHSHEDFANLFKENLEYESLVAKYNWTNDVYKHDFAYIKRVYDECNNNGSFLG